MADLGTLIEPEAIVNFKQGRVITLHAFPQKLR